MIVFVGDVQPVAVVQHHGHRPGELFVTGAETAAELA